MKRPRRVQEHHSLCLALGKERYFPTSAGLAAVLPLLSATRPPRQSWRVSANRMLR
jgi:hypothetical protein